ADVTAKDEVFILSQQLAAHFRPVQRVELHKRANHRLVLPCLVLAFLQNLAQRSALEQTLLSSGALNNAFAGIGIAEQVVESVDHGRFLRRAAALKAARWGVLRQTAQQLR